MSALLEDAMDKKLLLNVVTPAGVEISREVDLVVAPGVEGDLGVMPGHLPLMTRLRAGALRYYVGDDRFVLAVSDGYLEVTPTKVIVLAEAAEMPEEIDVERALAAKRRAEERLAKAMSTRVDLAATHASLQRALTRLRVAEQYGDARRKGQRDEKKPD